MQSDSVSRRSFLTSAAVGSTAFQIVKPELVRGAGNEIMGALTVSIPISRYTSSVRARTIQAVTNAARALSVQLGNAP